MLWFVSSSFDSPLKPNKIVQLWLINHSDWSAKNLSVTKIFPHHICHAPVVRPHLLVSGKPSSLGHWAGHYCYHSNGHIQSSHYRVSDNLLFEFLNKWRIVSWYQKLANELKLTSKLRLDKYKSLVAHYVCSLQEVRDNSLGPDLNWSFISNKWLVPTRLYILMFRLTS